MIFKPTKFRLRLASAAMLLTAAAVVALSVFLPIDRAKNPVVNSNASSSPSHGATTNPANEVVDFTDVLDMELSRPLIDAHPATGPSTVVTNAAVLGLRLTGTIMEPMHSYAVLTDGSGKTVIRSTGENAGGANILDINPDSVTLQLNGKPMVLHVVRPTALGASGK